MSNFLQQLFGMGGAQPAMPESVATPPAAPVGTPPPADPGMSMEEMQRAAALQSLQVSPPNTPRAPQTPLPVQPAAMNPEIMRMLMQSMQGTQGQLPPSLGAILRGQG